MSRKHELAVMPNGVMVKLRDDWKSRKISANFLADLHDKWDKYGDSILEKVAVEEPFKLFDAMVVLCKVHKVDMAVTHQNGFAGTRTKEQVIQEVENRAGPRGRALFEAFTRKFEELAEEEADA